MTQVTTTNLEQAIDTALLEMPIPGAVPSDADVSTYQKLHAAKLAEIARRAQGLPAVTDKASEEQNQKALTALVKVRTDIDKFRKAMFEPMKRIKDRVDGYLGTGADSGLQEQVSAIERPIRDRIAEYRNAEERKRQEAIRIIEERNKAREALVISKGMAWTGQSYSLLDLILWPTDLRNWDEAAWTRYITEQVDPRVAKMKEEAERKVREEAEAKERAKAEAERQKAEAERLAKEREVLERERAEFAKMKAEMEAKMEADAAVAMSKNSGITYSPDEVLVQETVDFLADKKRVRALSDAINATRVEDMVAPEEEPAPAATDAAQEYDLQELHACALALLDEANKAYTALGTEPLAIVRVHAMDCVRQTRELMKP